VPADNDRTFCTSNISAACYFYQSSALSYPNARAACKAMGGDLVSYNSEEEQQAVSNAICCTQAAFRAVSCSLQAYGCEYLLCRWRRTLGTASARVC
jgi:hypothetical protein